MTIKVTKTLEEEREIALPHYSKNKNQFYAIFGEQDMTVVYVSKAKPSISKSGVWLYKKEIGESEPITEEEFDNAFNQAMETLKQYQKEAV